MYRERNVEDFQEVGDVIMMIFMNLPPMLSVVGGKGNYMWFYVLEETVRLYGEEC